MAIYSYIQGKFCYIAIVIFRGGGGSTREGKLLSDSYYTCKSGRKHGGVPIHLNPFISSGLVDPDHLDEFIRSFRDFWGGFTIIIFYVGIHVSKQP